MKKKIIVLLLMALPVFWVLDYNSYFIRGTTTVTLEEIDTMFDTRFSDIGFWYGENQSYSLLNRKPTIYNVYGSFDFNDKAHYICIHYGI